MLISFLILFMKLFPLILNLFRLILCLFILLSDCLGYCQIIPMIDDFSYEALALNPLSIVVNQGFMTKDVLND